MFPIPLRIFNGILGRFRRDEKVEEGNEKLKKEPLREETRIVSEIGN